VTDTAIAYSATGTAWQAGPGRIYDRMAEAVVERSPVPLSGRLVLDVGAGTGAASRAIARAGGRAVGLDPAPGMLAVDRAARPPAVVADALALPLPTATIDAYVAAFSLTHVPDPGAALREAARVTRRGGPILASSYAADDDHPAKEAVLASLRAQGWQEPAWYREVREQLVPVLATVDGWAAVAEVAGLDVSVHAVRVPLPDLDAVALVAWRLGMAQAAPFVAGLAPADRAALVQDAVARLGEGWPPLVRSVLVLSAVA
jgi:SAM-dependent methyltransferase